MPLGEQARGTKIARAAISQWTMSAKSVTLKAQVRSAMLCWLRRTRTVWCITYLIVRLIGRQLNGNSQGDDWESSMRVDRAARTKKAKAKKVRKMQMAARQGLSSALQGGMCSDL